MPALLKSLVLITRSPPNCLLTVSSTATFSDAASTVNSVTTPMPTISADAVDDGAPRVPHRVLAGELAGHAAQERERRTERGRRRPRHDGPEHDEPEDREERSEPGDADAGTAGRADDHERDTACDRTAHRERGAPSKRRLRSSAISRSAAIGGTRDARIAGATLATSVTRMPTRERPDHGARPNRERSRRDTRTGRVHQREQAGRETDADRETERRTRRTPMTSASPVIDRNTCARDAPIARSNADSRVRCAIRIENVL